MPRGWILALGAILANPGIAETLQQRVERECGGPGFRDGVGCTIEIPKGDFFLSETLVIGDCTTTGARPSVTIEGQGSGRSSAVGNDANTGATTLVWNGPPSGVMIEVCGAPHFALRHLSLRMDPGEDGTRMAGVAVKLSADNRAGATTQNPIIHRVWIQGSKAIHGSLGIWITGAQKNDQVDHVHISDTHISQVGVCILVDSGQSAINKAEHLNCASYFRGIIVQDGAFHIESSYVGNLYGAFPGFVGIDLQRRPGAAANQYVTKAHQNVTITTSHFELSSGTFIRIAGSQFAQNIWSNNFSLQCKPRDCEQIVLDSHSIGPVVMLGNTIGASNRMDRTARIRHSGDGQLLLIGNYKRPNVRELIIESE